MKQNNERQWYFYDAKNQILGRLATQIADNLRCKKNPSFTNNVDSGDYVVVVNAEKIVLTGNKEDQKRYYRHTGYIGNLKTFTVPELRKNNPEEIIKKAVYGMLPSNKLRDDFMARLKIYAGPKHPHQNIKFANSTKPEDAKLKEAKE